MEMCQKCAFEIRNSTGHETRQATLANCKTEFLANYLLTFYGDTIGNVFRRILKIPKVYGRAQVDLFMFSALSIFKPDVHSWWENDVRTQDINIHGCAACGCFLGT